MSLSEEDTTRPLGVMLSEIQSVGMTEAQRIAAAAGINVTAQHWQPFRSTVAQAFRQMPLEDRMIVLKIFGDRLSERGQVKALLAQHGFEYVDGAFIPTAILDEREARFLPASSASELSRAMKRLVDGDETGAITSACGAVDTLMQQIYATPALAALGNPGNVSFAAKGSSGNNCFARLV